MAGNDAGILELAGSIMDTHTQLLEYLSALADGELAHSERELALAVLDTEAGRQAWQAWQCIGDVLRAQLPGNASDAPDTPDMQFAARLASRLAQEEASGSTVPSRQPDAALPLQRHPSAQR